MDDERSGHVDSQFSGQKLAEELTSMHDTVDRAEVSRESAWQEYQGYGSAYEAANAERVATGKIEMYRYPEVTIVAQINVDESGRAIDGHDYDPEAQSHRDTEKAFDDYLVRTKDHPEKRLVIVEGDVQAVPTDHRRAVEMRSDAGLSMAMAHEHEIEVISADPSREEVGQYLGDHGVDTIDRALSDTVAVLTKVLEQDPHRDLALEVYGQLALNGVMGFKRFSAEEQSALSKDPTAIEGIREQAIRIINDEFNPRLARQGGPQFAADEQGQYHLTGATPESLWTMTGPDGQGRLGEIMRMKLEVRDRHIFDTVTAAVDDGREPFMVFGGSHVVALKPAFDSYFGKAEH